MAADEGVFRFMLVRPAAADSHRSNTIEATAKTGEVTTVGDHESDLAGQLAATLRTPAEFADLRDLARRHADSDDHVRSLSDLPLDVASLVRSLQARASEPLTADAVCEATMEALGHEPDVVLRLPAFTEARRRLADTAVAASFVEHDDGDAIVTGIKALQLVEDAVRHTLPDAELIGRFLSRTLVTLPDFRATRQHASGSAELSEPVGAASSTDIAALIRARGEIMSALGARSAAAAEPEVADVSATAVAQEDPRERPQEPASVVQSAVRRSREASPGATAGEAARDVTAFRIAELSESARGALASIGIEAEMLRPIRALGQLDAMIARSAAASAVIDEMVTVGGAQLRASRVAGIFRGDAELGDLVEACEASAGVGDLLIVRQTLKAYELGEFAHVENVLKGESHSREHRRLDRTEETTSIETEREVEKERDLQSTERSELQAEATKVVKSEIGLEAGLQISGSYGPAVSFSSNLNASFSTSTEESQRKASSYSRDVTEKSAEKVRERVDEQRTKVVLAEIEEITKHGIDNKGGDGHIRGVYRWLNKVYDAQVFSYGQRMMFEFVIPEPAAFFLYAQSTDAPKDGPVPKPDPPMSNGKPLSPSHITAFDYVDWVGKYRVLNAPAPPPLLIDVSYFDRQDGLERNNLGRAAKVEIPTGYEAFSATVHFSVIWMGGFTPAFHLVMDGNPSNLDGTNQWGSATLWCGGEKEVSFGYTILNGVSFAIGIDIHCKLTDEGLRKWQQQVFDGVIEAYEQQLAAYNEQQRLAELRQEGRTLGQNPLENRRVEANELKKWVLMILTHDASLARDSFMPGAEPVLNFKTTCKNGSFIRFFENAFEWKNLLYALYPYFWGRKARWSTALHFQDPDPEFAAFLKAGAARVQVPVRPGFEKAVAHFCQYGEIWEGHDPPLRSDKTYVPIVQEIIENLGKLDDGVPYPEDSQPWEVKVPTSLVVLQDLEEIPAITDSLTGDPIALKPGP